MELFFARHARPAGYDLGRYPDDRQRPLTAEGRQEHQRIIHLLAPLLQPLDHILTSPYLRARQTADITAATLQFAGQVEETPVLGEAYTLGGALRLLQGYPREARLLCIGHEPNLRQLAGVFLDGEGRSDIDFQQSAMMGLTFHGRPVPGNGRLRLFIRPEELLRLGGTS